MKKYKSLSKLKFYKDYIIIIYIKVILLIIFHLKTMVVYFLTILAGLFSGAPKKLCKNPPVPFLRGSSSSPLDSYLTDF